MKRAFLSAAAVIFSACAVMEPPQGGPKDETPPKVLSILPEPGSTGVSRDASVLISFSEKIDGDSFKKRVKVYPPLEFDNIRAKGGEFEIRFRDEIPETTICVMIRSGFTDYHKVKSREDISFCFTTADSLDPGSISGRVLFKMKPDSTGLVRLVAAAEVDSTGEVRFASEARTAFCRHDGSFEFEALPADGKDFRIWAFIDKNSDARFSSSDEFSTVLEDTFRLTPSRTSFKGLQINIIDPDEPGNIEGSIIDLTGLDREPMARFDPLFEDGKAVLTLADTTGAFTLRMIPPGDYIYTAFIDISADSIPGTYPDPSDSLMTLDEPSAVYPDTVRVPPGGALKLEPLHIQKRNEEKDE